MTNEQIKQKAFDEAVKYSSLGYEQTPFADGYIAGAHSRDEEIDELKGEIERQKAIIAIDDLNEKALRKELDQLRNPWISVKEMLPDEGQAVIVRLAFGAGNHAACNYINGQFVWALCIETSNVNIQSRLKLPAITHWMPIPQIEKGE